MSKIDMSAKAVTQRLIRISQLRKLSLSLKKAGENSGLKKIIGIQNAKP